MSQPLRVLLVEDQADLRELMADALTGLGMQVATAADAASALSLLDAGTIVDVLLSDVYMPGQMSGAELAVRICGKFPEVRVILASGQGRQQLPELPVRIEFVQKPYSLAQVVGLLRNHASA